ncbi:MAG: hypothetical protein AAFY10_08665 [Pseudomonadota bacterium]
MLTVIKSIFQFGPLIFGIGFMAPLIAQVLTALEVSAPFGLSTLVVGLVVGGLMGVIAQVRGRWI